METDTKIALETYSTHKHATIQFNKELATAVITATNTYIPMDEFKAIFNETEKLVLKEKLTKLVFDKRALKIFHQPSMEWYFIEWKDKMYNFGLTKHRKLLPNDKIFRESVKIGREKIMREHPNLNIQRLDIQYFENFEDALTK